MPAWVIPYAEKVREFLGLQVWDLDYVPDDNPNNDDIRALGSCHCNSAYLTATIYLRPSHVAEPTMDARVTIVHELLHLSLAHYARAAEDIVTDLVDPSARKHAETVLVNALEQTIVRLSRQLAPQIPVDEPPPAPVLDDLVMRRKLLLYEPDPQPDEEPV